jgi:hypothetical protein
MQEYNRLVEFNGARRRFNPASKEDLKELSYFLKHKRWKTLCPFMLEWPHKDITSMCQVMYAQHMLKKMPK